jgi:large subunit ribosomal protein L6
MSRIGKQVITLPANTTLVLDGTKYVVTGAKGTLMVPSFEGVEVTQSEQDVQLSCANEDARPFYGLLRALLANAVIGVSNGWTRDLELHGVGWRASLAVTTLNLSLGFSHPISVDAPEGITFVVTKNVITVSGIDKQLVGETAAGIRRFRKPEPYKGKGIRFSDEKVRRKAGKAGKAAK